MEYVYAALLLHRLKQEINENNIRSVIKATGVEPDDVKIKALVAALSEVNIDEVLKSAAIPVAAAPSAATTTAAPSTKVEAEEEKKEEEKKGEEEAMAGLSALFG